MTKKRVGPCWVDLIFGAFRIPGALKCADMIDSASGGRVYEEEVTKQSKRETRAAATAYQIVSNLDASGSSQLVADHPRNHSHAKRHLHVSPFKIDTADCNPLHWCGILSSLTNMRITNLSRNVIRQPRGMFSHHSLHNCARASIPR